MNFEQAKALMRLGYNIVEMLDIGKLSRTPGWYTVKDNQVTYNSDFFTPGFKLNIPDEIGNDFKWGARQ